MAPLVVFSVCATLAVSASAAPVFSESFSSRETKWTPRIHQNLVRVDFGAKGRNFTGLVVTGLSTSKVDTAWSIRSPKIALPKERKPFFVLSFDISPDLLLDYTSEQGVQWQNALSWYGADGKPYGRFPICFAAAAGDFRTVRVAGAVPPDAASFEIQLGFDGPNLWGGDTVAYKDLQFAFSDTMDIAREKVSRGDFSPPRVKMTSPSPTTDRAIRPSFTVTDETAVDWTKTVMTLDGTNVTAKFRRAGDAFVWTDAANWSDGLHKLDVSVTDTLGHAYVAKKRFFIGEAPKTPKVTLRDDGMTLVDGAPFFPIGLYGVMRREFNDNDFTKAFEGLEKGGFNTSHSYGEARTPEYLRESERFGFKIWMETRLPDSRFVDKERHYPHVLAWYLGDDTSGHEKPWELRDYDEACRAVDPNRITCQADGVRSAAEFSAYQDYADGTDVFLPEIYPMVLDTPEENRECVARVIRDMKRVAADNAQANDGRPHGVWPIIQYFQGWGWKHFPTRAELFGMTYAAVCHGANGMTWYAYNGRVRPEKNQYNYGVTSTPERWSNICTLATQLKTLAPVLTERTGKQPPKPTVLSGPKNDPLGYDSISFLLKRHDGAAYLFAVNSADAPVKARFAVKGEHAVEALFEDRTFKTVDGEGLVDTFEPFGVHIYRLGGVRE